MLPGSVRHPPPPPGRRRSGCGGGDAPGPNSRQVRRGRESSGSWVPPPPWTGDARPGGSIPRLRISIPPPPPASSGPRSRPGPPPLPVRCPQPPPEESSDPPPAPLPGADPIRTMERARGRRGRARGTGAAPVPLPGGGGGGGGPGQTVGRGEGKVGRRGGVSRYGGGAVPFPPSPAPSRGACGATASRQGAPRRRSGARASTPAPVKNRSERQRRDESDTSRRGAAPAAPGEATGGVSGGGETPPLPPSPSPGTGAGRGSPSAVTSPRPGVTGAPEAAGGRSGRRRRRSEPRRRVLCCRRVPLSPLHAPGSPGRLGVVCPPPRSGPKGLRRRRDVSPPAPPPGRPAGAVSGTGPAPAMAGLLQALVGVSEKAAHIARLCRHEEPLFQLLVAEKTGPDRNRRFLQDFKTLADVLIQEVIKHDLGKEFPELQGHIHGEESNEFRNAQGETVTVRVCATPGDTAALLLSVLEPERAAAELLAAAVHRDVALGDAELAGAALSIPPQDLAVWIDPIDSTNEYIGGREDVAPVGGIAPGGLSSALVLIGAYDRHTGCPVLGVINEPFFRRDPLTRRWQGRYHWGVAYGDTRLCSLSPPPPPRPAPRLVLSRAEGGPVRAALGPLCGDGDGDGDGLRFAAGAGYKMLCVILGLADAYVLSEGSTFAWDACAPHAILRALGGGVVALAGALRARQAGDTGPPPELVYNRPAEGAAGAERWANRGGLVAYAHPQHLEAVLAALATVPGL